MRLRYLPKTGSCPAFSGAHKQSRQRVIGVAHPHHWKRYLGNHSRYQGRTSKLNVEKLTISSSFHYLIMIKWVLQHEEVQLISSVQIELNVDFWRLLKKKPLCVADGERRIFRDPDREEDHNHRRRRCRPGTGEPTRVKRTMCMLVPFVGWKYCTSLIIYSDLLFWYRNYFLPVSGNT